MKIAIVNRPNFALKQCELTFLNRVSIDLATAQKQHSNYIEALRNTGAQVEVLEVNQTSPDSAFVEDVAVILDELAVITSMGIAARREEVILMADLIAGFRQEVRHIPLPATIEGGDVLRVGKTLFVGESSRTNRAGIATLGEIVRPFGYNVVSVRVHGCLHLKTGVTALNDETFILNPDWIDPSPFENFKLIHVASDEPWGANVLRIENCLIVNASYPRTADRIDALGLRSDRVYISEFGKAEAGLTCMSLVFEKTITSAIATLPKSGKN